MDNLSCRPLKEPGSVPLQNKVVYPFLELDTSVHLITFSGSNAPFTSAEVESLDIDSEKLFRNSAPEDIFKDSKMVFNSNCNDQLAFSYIVEDVLHIRVLADYKSGRWNSEVIPLEFMKENDALKKNGDLWLTAFLGELLYFHLISTDEPASFTYNVVTKVVFKDLTIHDVHKIFFKKAHPTILKLKGMVPVREGSISPIIISSSDSE